MVRKVDRAAAFFAAVGRGFPSTSDLGGASLRALFGAEGLRRAEAPAAYLCRVIGFGWDNEAIPGQAPDSDGDLCPLEPSQRMVADYRLTLVGPHHRGRVVTTRTRVAYLRAANALMAIARDDDRSEPDQRDVRRLLWRTPGHRASLGPFLAWLRSERNLALVMPRRASRDRKTAERRLLSVASSLTSALERSSRPLAGRALLAACVSRLFGLPLERILRLDWEEVAFDDGIVLRVDDLVIEMPGRLVAQFERFAGRGGRGLIFPGRSGQRPLSAAAVSYHLGRSLGQRG